MASAVEQIKVLKGKVAKAALPEPLREKILTRLSQLEGLVESPTFLPEFDSISRYIEWIGSETEG